MTRGNWFKDASHRRPDPGEVESGLPHVAWDLSRVLLRRQLMKRQLFVIKSQ
jgi:hypothetical protein